MDIQLCVNDDGNIAVGVGHWEGRGSNRNPYPKRPANRCRGCYVDEFGDQFVRVEVLDERIAIADARTTEAVEVGGVAELDPAVTYIPALVYSGFVKVLPMAEPARAAAPTRHEE